MANWSTRPVGGFASPPRNVRLVAYSVGVTVTGPLPSGLVAERSARDVAGSGSPLHPESPMVAAQKKLLNFMSPSYLRGIDAASQGCC